MYHPFLEAVQRGCPEIDHYLATQALRRRADLTRIMEAGTIVGLHHSIGIHDTVLRTVANRYGHLGPIDESLLACIA